MTPDQQTEYLAQWMIERSFATGHGDTLSSLLEQLSWQVAELRQKYSAAEREACAKVVEADTSAPDDFAVAAMYLAIGAMRTLPADNTGVGFIIRNLEVAIDNLRNKPAQEGHQMRKTFNQEGQQMARDELWKAIRALWRAAPDWDDELERRVLKHIKAVASEEREACAKIAEADTSSDMLQDFGMQSHSAQLRTNIAAQIRARSP